MDVPQLTIGRMLLPISPFLAVIIAPNIVFLNVSSRIESRPTTATTRYADGSVVTESKQKDIKMVDLQWRLGPYAVSSSTTTESVFKYQTDSRTLPFAEGVALLRVRSWVAVSVFIIALIAWIVIGRVLQWHSCVTAHSSRSYPPLQTVGICLGVLSVTVVSFALMKPWWPNGVSQLVWWFRFTVHGVIPFISIVIVTPVAEELIFRSGVCRLLVERIGPAAGIFLQAVIFGSLHLATPLHMAVGFTGGIVLGMVYIYTRSLKASIILHAGANCILAVACLMVA